MKIVNSTGDILAVFVKFDDKGLPRFNTINTDSVFIIHGNLDTDFLIELYSLDSSKNSIIIRYLTNSYSIEEKKGFVVEELTQGEPDGPIIKILCTKNFS
jgi:hypothetical protein